MKRILSILPLIGIICIFYTGCAPTYLPNTLHTPLLYEKGEIEGNICTGTNQLDLQAAIALTDHIAIMGNFAYANFSDTADQFSRHQLAELGAGAFFPIGDAGSFEAYGGFGKGKGAANDIGLFNTRLTAEGNYNRIFLQANIGATTKIMEAGFGLRGSYISFSDYTEDGVVATDPPSEFFFEPVVFIRLGGGDNQHWNAKVLLQLGASLPATDMTVFEHQALMASLGVSFRFNRLYKKERIRDIRN